MTRITLAVFTLTVFAACSEKAKSPVRTHSKEYVYHTNKMIDSARHTVTGDLYYNFNNPGNKTVFQYISSSDIAGANDAGYSASLVFQADSGVTSFTYTNDELRQHLTYYSSGGAWSYFGPLFINKGYISGVKQGNDWKITIDVPLPQVDENAQIAIISETAIYKEANW